MIARSFAPFLLALVVAGCTKNADSDAPSCKNGFRNQCIDDVAVGSSFACARLADRTAWCWGRNDQGQLGYATTDVCPEDIGGGKTRAIACHTFPFQVSGLTDVVALASGNAFSCAALGDGSVRCWGANASGQLGNGKTVTSQSPVVVEGLGKVTQLAVGSTHACALVEGKVWCWGGNDRRQLGGDTGTTCPRDGSSIPCSTKPVAVAGLSNVTALTAGGGHSCALGSDGMVTCWGDNTWGQLGGATAGDGPPSMPGDPGDGGVDAEPFDAGPPGSARVKVLLAPSRPLTSAVAVSAGADHTCVLRDGGDVLCWGRADHGELGAAPPAGAAIGCPGPCSALALVVPGIPPVVEPKPDAGSDADADASAPVDATASTDAAAATDAVADVAEDSFDATPTNLGTFGRAIASGEGYACLRLGDGTVRCWGSDTVGQLGDGRTTSAARPATLVIATPGAAADNPLLGVEKVRAGVSSACAVMNDSSLRCWGSNREGALGVGHFTPQQGPVPVSW